MKFLHSDALGEEVANRDASSYEREARSAARASFVADDLVIVAERQENDWFITTVKSTC